MKRLASAITVALAVALGGTAAAQVPVVASAAVDRNVITIGDPIIFSVTVDLDTGYRVVDPGVPKTLGALELLETLPAQQLPRSNGGTRIIFRFAISGFSVGQTRIPSVAVAFVDAQGQRGTVATAEIPVLVRSVMLQGDDPTQIRPLKPQLDVPSGVPSPLRQGLAMVAGALFLAIPAYAALRLARRRQIEIAEARRPAQRALEELDRIASLGLPEAAKYEEHYELLTRALREYVRDRFGIAVHGCTARELRREMQRAGIDREQVGAIYEVMSEGEVVRFRHVAAFPAHARITLRSARDVLRKSARAEEYESAVLDQA